jgi:hypothetical protein
MTIGGGYGQFGLGAQNGFSAGLGSATSASMYGGRPVTTMPGLTTGATGSTTGGTSSSGNRSTSTTSGTQGGRGGTAGAAGGSRRGGSKSSASTPAQGAIYYEPRFEIGFDVVAAPKSQAANHVSRSLHSSNRSNSRFGDVKVTIEGSTAVLTGVVSSAYDRQLAEQVALLEPSVTAVRNELAVRTPAVAPSPKAPASSPAAEPKPTATLKPAAG